MGRIVARHAQRRRPEEHCRVHRQIRHGSRMRFLDRVEETLTFLAESPEAGNHCRFEADDVSQLLSIECSNSLDTCCSITQMIVSWRPAHHAQFAGHQRRV